MKMEDHAVRTLRLDANSAYLGIPARVLMENAGREVARECERFRSVAVFCGNGNNGGDGLVCARHLASAGRRVRVYVLEGGKTPDTEANLAVLERLDSVELGRIHDSSDCAGLASELSDFECVVDALLGVGVSGSLREPVAGIVSVLNGLSW